MLPARHRLPICHHSVTISWYLQVNSDWLTSKNKSQSSYHNWRFFRHALTYLREKKSPSTPVSSYDIFTDTPAYSQTPTLFPGATHRSDFTILHPPPLDTHTFLPSCRTLRSHSPVPHTHFFCSCPPHTVLPSMSHTQYSPSCHTQSCLSCPPPYTHICSSHHVASPSKDAYILRKQETWNFGIPCD